MFVRFSFDDNYDQRRQICQRKDALLPISSIQKPESNKKHSLILDRTIRLIEKSFYQAPPLNSEFPSYIIQLFSSASLAIVLLAIDSYSSRKRSLSNANAKLARLSR